jgi:peptidoglycan/xylan/chitin deacetylase (PgdA/CDA1 family)
MKICSITYHEVVDNPDDSGIRRESALPYKHSVNEFTDHAAIFIHNNIKTPQITNLKLDEEDALTHIITFDDGGISNLKAADILEQNGFIGHFFITTSFIGMPGFMDSTQIQDLYRRGHVIGAHSHTHPDVFYRLPYGLMLEEWKKSKGILENIIGDSVTCASVPGGEMNEKTWNSSAESGIEFLFCSEPFIKPRKGSNWLLGRVCPKQGTDYKKIANFVNFKGYAYEMSVRKIKNIVKRVYYPLHDLLKSNQL